MKRIISIFLSVIFIITGISTSAVVAYAYSIDGTSALVRYSDWLKGTNSTLNISISNLPADAGLANGTYSGWCVQAGITGLLYDKQAKLYDSMNTSLPSDLSGLPWHEINYVLNHKIHGTGKTELEFHKDVQTAIWLLMGDTNLEFGISPEAQLMVDNARAHPDYIPGNGDLRAIIVYSDGITGQKTDKVQEVIIEVEVHLPTPTSTSTSTPTVTSSASVTPTGSITSTFTPTATSSACVPTVMTVDFSKVAVGASVEGMGAIAPNLNIDAKNTAARVVENFAPTMYVANKNGVSTINGFMASGGGFSDIDTRNAIQAHLYTFTFAPGTSVGNFSVHMLDFGDANPSLSTNHYASLTAYDANNNPIAKHELNYTSPAVTNPVSSNIYGNLAISGDASAPAGNPGNWKWNVSASGIVKLVLEFGAGFDPNISFDLITYTTECAPNNSTPTNTPGTTPTNTPTATATSSACVPTVMTADFSKVAVGTSVEGMGTIAPNLNIDAKNTAVKVVENANPFFYVANKNGVNVINGYTVSGGGFSDLDTRNAGLPHLYTFTLAPGTSISTFSVHMLDFGDISPSGTANHYASMTAFDVNNNPIAKHEMNYITPAVVYPTSSNLFGNLQFTGDASAPAGNPGNWKWKVAANGIVKIVLEFGAGFDPNISFDLIVYTTECAPINSTPTSTPATTPTNTPTATATGSACVPTVINADFSKVAVGASVEGMGTIAPNLNIDAKNTAVKVVENANPFFYVANKNGVNVINGYTVPGGGFSDLDTRNAGQPHLYTFTFALGTSVSTFSVHMLDFGDISPSATANHYASMTAYNTSNNPIAKHEMNYTTPAVVYPTSSNLFGNLSITGDASAPAGNPGNWKWKVAANGIVKIVLEFGAGFDPNISFDLITYTTECH